MPFDRKARSVAEVADDQDDTHCSRWERLIALTKRELLSLGNGDPSTGRLGLHPGLLIRALDAHPHLPTSQIPVPRARTVEALREARALRESKWDDKTDSERVVSLTTSDVIHGVSASAGAAHNYIQNVINQGGPLAPDPFQD